MPLLEYPDLPALFTLATTKMARPHPSDMLRLRNELGCSMMCAGTLLLLFDGDGNAATSWLLHSIPRVLDPKKAEILARREKGVITEEEHELVKPELQRWADFAQEFRNRFIAHVRHSCPALPNFPSAN